MALLSVALGGLLALGSEAGRRPGTAEPVDVVIVGAGWAGMAAADSLARANVSFVVLESSHQMQDFSTLWCHYFARRVSAAPDRRNGCQPTPRDQLDHAARSPRQSDGFCRFPASIGAFSPPHLSSSSSR